MTFKEHDEVQDTSGFTGTIADVVKDGDTEYYEVRFSSGRAVRFADELTMITEYIKPAKSFAQECAEYLALHNK